MTKQPDQKPKAYQCRHIFTDGHRCGSRALRQEEFCYYHHATRRPVPQTSNFPHAAPPASAPADTTFDLPFPEDRAAIQTSIGEILRRIAQNQIDPRRAGLLLYGLQIASCNLPKPTPASARDREEEDPEVAEITDHPTYGPIAPEAEYIPYQRPLTFAGRILRDLELEEAEAPTNLQAAEDPQRHTPIPSHPHHQLDARLGELSASTAPPLRLKDSSGQHATVQGKKRGSLRNRRSYHRG